jgi:hypothetical protein
MLRKNLFVLSIVKDIIIYYAKSKFESYRYFSIPHVIFHQLKIYASDF